MDVEQESLQPHAGSSQSDVEMQPVYWKDSVDEELRAAVMSGAGRESREPQLPPTQTTRSSRLLLESPITRRPRRSVLSSHPYSPSQSTSTRRPRRMRSLPQPVQSGVATIEGGDVPGPSRSKSEPESLHMAGKQPQSSVDGDRLDRLIYQVEAKLQEQQLGGCGISSQRVIQSGKNSQSTPLNTAQKRGDIVKPTIAQTSARRETTIIASPAITPSRVLRDRTKQESPIIHQTSLKVTKPLLDQKMVMRGPPREIALNIRSDRERRPNDSAKKSTMKPASDMVVAALPTPSRNPPRQTFNPKPENPTLAITSRNENMKAGPLLATNSSRENVRQRGQAVALTPQGLRLGVKATAQGVGSQAKRPHTFKTPFLNQPQTPVKMTVEPKDAAPDVEMGGSGNESFDSIDMDAMFLDGGEEVEALLRAYDG